MFCLTYRYAAPEIIPDESNKISKKYVTSDIWSLGAIIFEILLKIKPFKGLNDESEFI